MADPFSTPHLQQQPLPQQIQQLPRSRTTTSSSSTSMDSLRLQTSLSSSLSQSSTRSPSGSLASTPINTNPGQQHSQSQLTMQNALLAANDDPIVALENVLNERNMLSSQNAQLWKLIEKQRSGYANVLRELERVRAERDQARGRSRTAPNPAPPVPSMSLSTNGSESEGTPKQRPIPPRHSSDDGGASPSQRNQPSLSPSRSHDRLYAKSQSSSTAASSTPDLQATLPLHLQHHRSPSSSSTASASLGMATQPLHIHKSVPGPIVPPPPPPMQFMAPPPPPSLPNPSPPPAKAPTPPPVAAPSPVSAPPMAPPQVQIPTPVVQTQPAQQPRSATASLPPAMVPRSESPQKSAPLTLAPPASAYGEGGKKRESTISLPPEARQYMMGMFNGDGSPSSSTGNSPNPAISEMQSRESPIITMSSPPPTPRAWDTNTTSANNVPNTASSSQSQLGASGASPGVDASSPINSASGHSHLSASSISYAGSAPFVDMDDSTEEGSHEGHEAAGGSEEAYVEEESAPSASSMPNPFSDDETGQSTTSMPTSYGTERDDEKESVLSGSQGWNGGYTPGPPPTRPLPQPQTQPPPQQFYPQSPPTQPPASVSISQQLLKDPQSYMYSEPAQSVSRRQQSLLQRLTPNDLPGTRLKVLTSTIRPNERGKEVLSFIVVVTPSSEKEPWKVEKLYSNVLALDTRVRALLGRSQLKKIAPLPDNKLFKDNAPAKVDQRKAVLEAYLQSLLNPPSSSSSRGAASNAAVYADEICEFFSSDLISEAKRAPVAQMGYKEGYLTKRGKNFGGWKTRYFVLQGPVLEYYESRGGAHLGSINVTGAQIGRQQKAAPTKESEDENEYRHAFLIIEAKRGPGGQHNRHVLCAESDVERDSWVDVLVRYVMGTYDEGALGVVGSSSASSVGRPSADIGTNLERTSTNASDRSRERKGSGKMPLDISKGPAVPISQLPQEMQYSHSKLFQSAPMPYEIGANSSTTSLNNFNGVGAGNGSPVERSSSTDMQRRAVERAHAVSNGEAGTASVGLSSSLPSGSSMEQAAAISNSGAPAGRSNSEQGYYPDMHPPQGLYPGLSPAQQQQQQQQQQQLHPSAGGMRNRQSYMPTLGTVQASPTYPPPPDRNERPSSPEQDINKHARSLNGPSPSQSQNIPNGRTSESSASKPKISGPMGGAAIPAGFKFGARDTPATLEPPTSTNDRDRKAKSGAFWRFGRGDKAPGGSSNGAAGNSLHPGANIPHRAVTGVPLVDSLAVVEIAHLPAIVFRCIQYLEAKKAEQEEGIYRLSGSSAVIKSLKDRFNTEGDVDLLKSDEHWDPHAIAGLLKTFLRELPTSILTRDLHMRFLAVMDLASPPERVAELSRLVSRLPFENYSLLRALTAHLILIVQNANLNKMTVRNVGIVFSPTLGIPAGVFSLMLGEFNRVFNVDGAGTESGEEESEPTEQAPNSPSSKRLSLNSHRNSKNYQESSADQLLGLGGRTLPAPIEGQSDLEEDISVTEESSAETDDLETDAAPTLDSVSSRTTQEGTPSPDKSKDLYGTPRASQDSKDEGTPTRPPRHTARAANIAAGRGLQIGTDNSPAAKRFSRQSGMVGLPHSPRPHHAPASQGSGGLSASPRVSATSSVPSPPQNKS